jgi:hypothetical protein
MFINSSESYKDLCRRYMISRSDHNVYSPRYKEYLGKKYLKLKKRYK